MSGEVVVRQNGRGELVMPYEVFRRADFGQLCARLGLRPSQPDRNASGERRKAKR